MRDVSASLDVAPLIEFEERRCSAPLDLVSVDTVAMKGGYMAKALYRHDCRFRQPDGREHATAFAQKFCKASEVRMLQELAVACTAPSLPEIIDAKRSDDRLEDLAANWFVSPFYPGRELTFGEPVPDDVLITLARIHVGLADVAKTASWTWTFDAEHLEKTHREAVEALATAELFRQTVSDHQSWRVRLEALGRSVALRDFTDELAKTLAHGDMHPGNVIVGNDGRCIIIDWGNACVAPPFLDLANIIPIDSPSWRVYCDAYREAGGSISAKTAQLGYLWAQAATGMQYLPWIARNKPDAPRIVAQIIEAERQLAQLHFW